MTAPTPTPAPPPTMGPQTTSLSAPTNRLLTAAGAVLGLFALLLTSFPARNLDLWSRLAGGRDLFRAGGGFGPTWLYDFMTWVVFSVASGGGLVAVKALLCGAVAVLLFRLSLTTGWRVAFAVTGLAVLAMSSRLLLQPETVSVACLAIALWLIHGRPRPTALSGYWPGWPLVALFAVWCNLDGRFVFGLVVVGLTRFGQLLDTPGPEAFPKRFLRWVGAGAILIAASCLSPSHAFALRVPPEMLEAVSALTAPPGRDVPNIYSPFEPDYVDLFRDNSSALAYYPLLALGLISFLLNRKGLRWGWFLPWLALAVVSGLQARTIPLFAVVAGPVTAWNIQAYFARRSPAPSRPRSRLIGMALGGLVVLAFLVAAWPGWLQGPPYEPRRWATDCPPALQRGAEFVQRTHANRLWKDDSRALHVSPETLAVFHWFCPEDRGVYDPAAVDALPKEGSRETNRQKLRELGISRVVVYAGDPSLSSKLVMDRLLATPDEWKVLTLWGGLVVFGWDDPERGTGPNPYARWEVDFNAVAYHPPETDLAPTGPPPPSRDWWQVLWTPAYPTRPPARDEAAVLLRKAEWSRADAPLRNLVDWEMSQIAALVGAGSGWGGPLSGVDAAVRLTIYHPPPPTQRGVRPPPQTELAFAFFQQFAAARSQTPVGLVYAAVRAARRAVAENPNDPFSYLVLAQAYSALEYGTEEQVWAARMPQIQRVRQTQKSAALNKAVALNPRFAAAHLDLANLYKQNGCLDLAVQHLRAYRDLPPRAGGPPRAGSVREAVDAQLNEWTKLLDSRTQTYEAETTKASVNERTLRAMQLELGGKALEVLLKSDVAAFGAEGVEREAVLLLRTGRPQDVLDWMTEEVRGSLGDETFHFFRAQAHMGVGDYTAANAELSEMIGAEGRLPAPQPIVDDVAQWVGKGVLDFVPLGAQPHDGFWREPRQTELEERINDITRTLARHSNMTVLQGIIAMEVGDAARAAELFRRPLVFSPNRLGRGGQLDFAGRLVAWHGLSLLGDPPPTK